MLSTNTKPNWTPVLMSGGTYCSPACGCGCTKEMYDEAVQRADELAARMGDGWEPRVWENAGWFFEVTKGVATITWRRLPQVYSAHLNTRPQIVTEAETPEDALGFALQEARTIERRLAADCAALLD